MAACATTCASSRHPNLSQVVEVRKRQGKSAALTEEETQLSLVDCHELLSKEMEAVKPKLRLSRPGKPEPKVWHIVGWSVASAVGISAH
jgi:formate-dependent nitrite reductase cytochrome c552 subunit